MNFRGPLGLQRSNLKALRTISEERNAPLQGELVTGRAPVPAKSCVGRLARLAYFERWRILRRRFCKRRVRFFTHFQRIAARAFLYLERVPRLQTEKYAAQEDGFPGVSQQQVTTTCRPWLASKTAADSA